MDVIYLAIPFLLIKSFVPLFSPLLPYSLSSSIFLTLFPSTHSPSHLLLPSPLLFVFKDFIYFIFRERGKEGEKQGEK